MAAQLERAAQHEETVQFWQRHNALNQYEDTRKKLIEDLLAYSQTINTGHYDEIQRLRADLSNALLNSASLTRLNNDMKKRLFSEQQDKQKLLREKETMHTRSPYIAVLLDGDGILFQESFVRQGLDGGKKAAHALRKAIAQACGDILGECEVVAKVCANLAGLSRAMRRDGFINYESDAKDFTLGLTQGRALFDFVDVGYGKERADTKIKEATKWHLRNANCRYVVLGISHDAGYAPFLDEILDDDDARRRVVILEGAPTVRDLVATNVTIVNLNDTLFRGEKLQTPSPLQERTPDRVYSMPMHSQQPPETLSACSSATICPPSRSSTNYFATLSAASTTPSAIALARSNSAASASTASTSNASVFSGSPASVHTTLSSGGPGTAAMGPPPVACTPAPASYAGVAAVAASSSAGDSPPSSRAASPPPMLTLPACTAKVLRQKQIASSIAAAEKRHAARVQAEVDSWTPAPRGRDPVSEYEAADLDALKRRKPSQRLCNSWYLRGTCPKRNGVGDTPCTFVHDEVVSPPMLRALAALARQNRCDSGQQCLMDECIYGHHCPSVTKDGRCPAPYCKFYQDEHPPHTKFLPTYEQSERGGGSSSCCEEEQYTIVQK